jgi:hypothetical protein
VLLGAGPSGRLFLEGHKRMAEGRDISNWQGAPAPGWFAQYDFVIVQAFNEHGGANPYFNQSMANGAGRCKYGLGVYGWAISGADNFALGAQLGHIGNAWGVTMGCWDDHEQGGRGAWPVSPGEMEQYLAGIESTGQKGGYYSNGSDFVSTPFLNGRPWWYANPSGNRNPRPPLIVQYGTPGGVDANRADDAALDAWTKHVGPKPKQSTIAWSTNKMNLICFITDGTPPGWVNFGAGQAAFVPVSPGEAYKAASSGYINKGNLTATQFNLIRSGQPA